MEPIKSYGLEKVHRQLLIVLDEFDRICRDNQIYYSLHGGTLLGAERNHKIIPWDDDIDVSMKRSEYKKFQAIAKQVMPPFSLDEESMWFPRFVMKTNGEVFYIDILIWDYISENKVSQFVKINLLRAFQGMLKPKIEYERFGLFNKFLLFFTHVVGKLFSRRKKLKWFRDIEENRFLGSKVYIHRSNDAFKDVSYIFDKNYMDEYMDIELEGKQYMVNERYHEFLVCSYGEDYLIPPPSSERNPRHKSFRENLLGS